MAHNSGPRKGASLSCWRRDRACRLLTITSGLPTSREEINAFQGYAHACIVVDLAALWLCRSSMLISAVHGHEACSYIPALLALFFYGFLALFLRFFLRFFIVVLRIGIFLWLLNGCIGAFFWFYLCFVKVLLAFRTRGGIIVIRFEAITHPAKFFERHKTKWYSFCSCHGFVVRRTAKSVTVTSETEIKCMFRFVYTTARHLSM